MKTWLEQPDSDAPCTIIGEIAQAHDGSLGAAHAYIDAIADAGADAVKFQTHIADAESTLAEPWRTKFSHQDETRLDYWRRMEFSEEQWVGLKQHAEDKNLLFLSSPFSLEAFELLRRIGVAGWKVASGEITNFPLLDAMSATGQPMMMSCGMSAFEEIDAAVERVNLARDKLAVMQCSSIYPTGPEHVGLNLLAEFKSRYGCAVGLSDHSATIYPALAAVMASAQVVEVHVTLSRDMFGPDVIASLTPDELRQTVDGIRFIEKMNANPIDKSKPLAQAEPLRQIFLKSVVAVTDLPAGTVLTPDNITTKKPGTGIPANQYDDILGKILSRNVKSDTPLMLEDLESS